MSQGTKGTQLPGEIRRALAGRRLLIQSSKDEQEFDRKVKKGTSRQEADRNAQRLFG